MKNKPLKIFSIKHSEFNEEFKILADNAKDAIDNFTEWFNNEYEYNYRYSDGYIESVNLCFGDEVIY